jgi:hypothetical protein
MGRFFIYSSQHISMGKFRGQSSMEYMLLLSATIIIISSVFVMTRGNVIGQVTQNVNKNSVTVGEALESFTPDSPIITNVVGNGQYLFWKTNVPSTSAVLIFPGPNLPMIPAGSNMLTTSHKVFMEPCIISCQYQIVSCLTGSDCSKTTQFGFELVEQSGDANGDGVVDIKDYNVTIDYIFEHGTAPTLIRGDADCDGNIDISDAVYLIAYLYSNGTAPGTGPNCTGQMPWIMEVNVTNSSISPYLEFINWTVSYDANYTLFYGPTSSYGQAVSGSSKYRSHNVILTGLTPNTLYYYFIMSCNLQYCSNSSEYSFQTLPGLLEYVSNYSITQTSAWINWTTIQAANYTLLYGPTLAYGMTKTNSTTASYHDVALTSLSTDTTYHYKIISCSASYCSNSSDYTFKTQSFFVSVSNYSITQTSAIINWTTSENANYTLLYGPTTSYGTVVNGPIFDTYQMVPLSGLNMGATYHFKIIGCSTSYCSNSSDYTFQTLSFFVSVSNYSITSSSAIIDWTTTNKANYTIFYGPSASFGFTVSNSTLASSHIKTLTGLPADKSCYYKIRGCTNTFCSDSQVYTFRTAQPSGGS